MPSISLNVSPPRGYGRCGSRVPRKGCGSAALLGHGLLVLAVAFGVSAPVALARPAENLLIPLH